MKRLGIGSALALVLVLAVLARSTTTPAVFFRDQVLLPGADAYYHLRRITYAAETGGAIPRHDRYQHYPDGAEAIWPPAFDATWAMLLPMIVGSDPSAVERAAPWIPVVLGGLAVLLTFAAARVLAPQRPALAWFAALALSLIGGHLSYTRLGFVDHHGAQGVWIAGLLACGGLALDRAGTRTGIAGALGVGLAIGVALLVWPGNLMLLGLWAAVLLIGNALTLRSGCTGPPLLGVSVVSLATLTLTLVIGAFFSLSPTAEAWSLTRLSWLQPMLAGVLTAMALGAAGGARLERFGPRRAAIAGAVIVLIVVGLAGFLLSGEALEEAVEDSLQWLTKAEAFQASVVESLPLLRSQTGEWELATAHLQLSFGMGLIPFGALMLAWRGWRRGRASATLWAIAFAMLMTLTLLQRRFVDTSSVVAALSLAALLEWLWSSPLQTSRGRLMVRVATGLLFVAAFWPSETRLFEGVSAWANASEAELLRSPTLREKWQLHRAAGWLRESTPETRGFFDTSLEPEYGVLSTWSRGHVLAVVGRRPVVVNNFGDDLGDRHFEDSERFFETENVDEALAILDRYRCRYLVSEEPRDQTLGAALLARVAVQLHVADGVSIRREGAPVQAPVEGLRLCFETGPPSGRSKAPGMFKVWERVPGALLTGSGPPGEPITVRARVVTNRQRGIEWSSSGTCDSDGRFALRVPYSTDLGGVHVVGAVRLSCAGLEAKVSVSESAVRSGAEVPVQEWQ